MEIKICEKCQSLCTSEDTSTGKHTCLTCGHESMGTSIDFFGVRENEKTVKHSPRFKPFMIQQKVKRTNDFSLIPRPETPIEPIIQ